MRRVYWKNTVQPGEAFHLARLRLQEPQSVQPHDHDFAEVLWLEQGACACEINGRRITLQRGDLIMTRPTDAHGLNPLGGSFTLVNFAFPLSTLNFLRDRYYGGAPDFWGGKEALPRVTKLNAAQRKKLAHWTTPLFSAPRSCLIADRFLLNLLSELSPNDKTGVATVLPNWLRNACAQMCVPEHFAGGTVELARLAGRSPEHVARVLKAAMGRTPGEIVNAARMEYAASQLAADDKEIIAIAMDCGFESLSHFYRLFHERWGVTPRRYRLERRKTATLNSAPFPMKPSGRSRKELRS
jgi:AraC family cel operon transcriptional repressor